MKMHLMKAWTATPDGNGFATVVTWCGLRHPERHFNSAQRVEDAERVVGISKSGGHGLTGVCKTCVAHAKSARELVNAHPQA